MNEKYYRIAPGARIDMTKRAPRIAEMRIMIAQFIIA